MEVAALLLGTAVLGAAGAASRRLRSLKKDHQGREDDQHLIQPNTNVPPGFLVKQPKNTLEALLYISEALRFFHSETFGRWAFADLVIGLRYLARREGEPHPTVEVYSKSQPLRMHMAEERELVRTLQRFVSLSMALRESNPATRQAIWALLDYREGDFFKRETKVGILRPLFAFLLDRQVGPQGALVVAIRGTHSLKDTFTCLAGAQRPFHMFREDGSLVMGQCHCGVMAAAKHIFDDLKDTLLQAVKDHPTLPVYTLGHSLGAGTAVVLCSMLREKLGGQVPQLAGARCFAFACPAVMTFELAEAASEFTTTVLNGADIIPSFSHNQMDRLREEVAGSSWRDEFKNDLSNTRIYRAANAVGQVTLGAASRVSRTVSALLHRGAPGDRSALYRAPLESQEEEGPSTSSQPPVPPASPSAREAVAGDSPRGLGRKGGFLLQKKFQGSRRAAPLEYRTNLGQMMGQVAVAGSRTIDSVKTAAGNVGSLLGPFIKRGLSRLPTRQEGGEAAPDVPLGEPDTVPSSTLPAEPSTEPLTIEVPSTPPLGSHVRGASPRMPQGSYDSPRSSVHSLSAHHERSRSRLSSDLDRLTIEAVLMSQVPAAHEEGGRSPSLVDHASRASSLIDEGEEGPNVDDLETGVEDIDAFLDDGEARGNEEGEFPEPSAPPHPDDVAAEDARASQARAQGDPSAPTSVPQVPSAPAAGPSTSDQEASQHYRQMLFPVGRILHLIPMHVVNRTVRREGSPTESGGDEAATRATTPPVEPPPSWALVEVDRMAYTRIRLCSESVRDHFLASYAQSLVGVGLSRFDMPSQVVWGTVPRMFVRTLPVEALDPTGHSHSLRTHAALYGGTDTNGQPLPNPSPVPRFALTLSPSRLLSRVGRRPGNSPPLPQGEVLGVPVDGGVSTSNGPGNGGSDSQVGLVPQPFPGTEPATGRGGGNVNGNSHGPGHVAVGIPVTLPVAQEAYGAAVI